MSVGRELARRRLDQGWLQAGLFVDFVRRLLALFGGFFRRHWMPVYASNARVDGLGPDDLLVEYSVTFPTDGMFEAIRDSRDVQRLKDKYDFGWNASTRTMTYTVGGRRRRR